MNPVEIKPKTYPYDGLFWFFMLLFLAMLAFVMLTRDLKKQYGAVAFGTFPAFDAVDQSKKHFDQHQLQGSLSAVMVSDKEVSADQLKYLRMLSLSTARGKKYLHNIVLTSQLTGVSDKWLTYLTLNASDFKKIDAWQTQSFKRGVILVDQNGVIRGVFDLSEKLDRINFEGAVRGIL